MRASTSTHSQAAADANYHWFIEVASAQGLEALRSTNTRLSGRAHDPAAMGRMSGCISPTIITGGAGLEAALRAILSD